MQAEIFVPISEWTKIKKRLDKLESSVARAGGAFSYDYELVASDDTTQGSDDDVFPSDWVTPVDTEYKVTIDANIRGDKWELVGIARRQIDGITFDSFWDDTNVRIPVDFYAEGANHNSIKCDHCKTLKRGKTARNYGVVIHEINSPLDIQYDDNGESTNYRMVGSGCIPKYQELMDDSIVKMLEELLKIYSSVKKASTGDVTEDNSRFSINTHLWIMLSLLAANSPHSSKAATLEMLAVSMSRRILNGESPFDVLSSLQMTYDIEDLKNARDAATALCQDILSVDTGGISDPLALENIHNAQVFVKSKFIAPQDATFSNYITIVKGYLSTGIREITEEEFLAIMYGATYSYHSRSFVYPPLELLTSWNEHYGDIYIGYNKDFIDDVKGVGGYLNNPKWTLEEWKQKHAEVADELKQGEAFYTKEEFAQKFEKINKVDLTAQRNEENDKIKRVTGGYLRDDVLHEEEGVITSVDNIQAYHLYWIDIGNNRTVSVRSYRDFKQGDKVMVDNATIETIFLRPNTSNPTGCRLDCGWDRRGNYCIFPRNPTPSPSPAQPTKTEVKVGDTLSNLKVGKTTIYPSDWGYGCYFNFCADGNSYYVSLGKDRGKALYDDWQSNGETISTISGVVKTLAANRRGGPKKQHLIDLTGYTK